MPIRVGLGWERVESARLCSSFLIASYEPSVKRSRLLRFGKTQESFPLKATSARSLVSAGGRLYFISPHEGLFSCEIGTGDAQAICQVQRGRVFESMWMDSVSGKALVLQSERESSGEMKSLLKIELSSGHVEIVMTLPENPSFIAVTGSHRGFYSAYHAPNGMGKIDFVDLGSGERKSISESSGLHGIALSSCGEIVHWPLNDCGPIELLEAKGTRLCLTEFGWFPAFSRNGDMAFIMGDHTLWIRTQTGQLLRTVLGRWVNPAEMVAPSWCPCGNHVAALVGGGFQDNWVARDLVFADVVRKEVTIFEQVIVNPALNIGGQVWMPK